MRLWNLTEYDELEDRVVLSYAAPRKQGRISTRGRLCRLTVSTLAALLVAELAIFPVKTNSNSVLIPRYAAAVAQSLPEPRPPLDRVFSNRFEEFWTEEVEHSLLSKVAATAETRLTPEALTEQIIDSVFSNQQEEISGVNRLSRAEVARIVRRRSVTS